MSDYIEPITDIFEIDDEQCVAGYLAGCGFKAADYTQKSRSYWHGYRNGRADKGLEPPSPQSQAMARQMVDAWRSKGMH